MRPMHDSILSLQKLKWFLCCGVPNGCCHSALLSKLPEWGFGFESYQCGWFQHSTGPPQVSLHWGKLHKCPPSLPSLPSVEMLPFLPLLATLFISDFAEMWLCRTLLFGGVCRKQNRKDISAISFSIVSWFYCKFPRAGLDSSAVTCL